MLTGLLESLGLGGSIVTAAMLVLVALYLRRAAKAGSLAVGFASATVGYTMVILGVAAVAVGLGWVDPRPSTMLEHARTGWAYATEEGVTLLKRAWSFLSGFVG